MARKGKLITLEGGEGCGKSTLLPRLAGRIRAAGHTVLTTRDPGGTDIGGQIRHILQHSRQSIAMASETELLLYCASRAQLVHEVIVPALERGEIVLGDRFYDSTTVYQGVGRQLDLRAVEQIVEFSAAGCVPNLTVVIDLDPRVGLERVRGRELFDRMDNQSLEFYERVRRGYLDLAKREPRRVKVVNGSQSVEAVEEQVWRTIEQVLD
jgi:dTMP kinase